MGDHERYRNELLAGAIRATAERGLEGITTRAIAEAVSLNEAYIYRYYLDRNDLLEKAFMRSDEELMEFIRQEFETMKSSSLPFRERFAIFFNRVWDFSVKDHIYCLFYVRYCYSTFFTDKVRDKHMALINEKIPLEKEYFLEGTDPALIRHHIVVSTLSYLMDIATGHRTDTPEERDKICSLMYNTLLIYLDPAKIHNFQ